MVPAGLQGLRLLHMLGQEWAGHWKGDLGWQGWWQQHEQVQKT